MAGPSNAKLSQSRHHDARAGPSNAKLSQSRRTRASGAAHRSGFQEPTPKNGSPRGNESTTLGAQGAPRSGRYNLEWVHATARRATRAAHINRAASARAHTVIGSSRCPQTPKLTQPLHPPSSKYRERPDHSQQGAHDSSTHVAEQASARPYGRPKAA